MKKEFEVWADSFHEGEWFCEKIKKFFKLKNIEYIDGFIPKYEFLYENLEITFIVYGNYKSWNPIPKCIKDLLDWGKPDFILYDRLKDSIIFSVEETAATPTGNQALQRCERMYGAARKKVPFWYFISEFGQHSDGKIRKDSIWPSIMALKLSIAFRTPCIVLHYSDENHVEDYNSGEGLNSLFSSLFLFILQYCNYLKNLIDLETIIFQQYMKMLFYIKDQWENIVQFIPFDYFIQDIEKASNFLTELVIKNNEKNLNDNLQKFFLWPKAAELPKINLIRSKELIKFDPLAFLLEKNLDILKKNSYILSDNAGSGKPPGKKELLNWIENQNKLFEETYSIYELEKDLFKLNIKDFPKTENGNYHLTTAKNIFYLFDTWAELEKIIIAAFPRLKNKFVHLENKKNKPALIYISNSITPGRLFGDPYTGQISAFSCIFGKIDKSERVIIAYFPHQNFSQAVTKTSNKGKVLMKELTDCLIFGGGIGVNLSKNEVL